MGMSEMGKGKDRDFRGQRLSQKHKERFSKSGETLVASKSADEEHTIEKRSTKLYNYIIFLLGLFNMGTNRNRKKQASRQKQVRQRSNYHICL